MPYFSGSEIEGNEKLKEKFDDLSVLEKRNMIRQTKKTDPD
jgi:hypothetical protein